MLIEFSVENYLSFKDEVVFSMLAHKPIKGDHEPENVIEIEEAKEKLLKTAVIYGANGSGKSNFLQAIRFFRGFTLNSVRKGVEGQKIPLSPFKLSSQLAIKPSIFEMTFILEGIQYRYGFEANREKVSAEWLFALPQKKNAKEKELFTRKEQDIHLVNANFSEGKNITGNVRKNALFLSTVAQLNGEISNKIRKYFDEEVQVISALDDLKYINYTVDRLKDKEFEQKMLSFFEQAQIGVEQIEVVEEGELLMQLQSIKENSKKAEEVDKAINDIKDFIKQRLGQIGGVDESEEKNISIQFLHRTFDLEGKPQELVRLDFGEESKGTQKLFNLFGLWMQAIEQGKVLIIDELDARLHTLLTKQLIKLFHSQGNKKGQLLFASHDTALLKKDIFRRDQIWFAEKDKQGATDLYSLVEYKVNQAKIRKDASFEKDYLMGKYGAIPFMGNKQEFQEAFISN